MVEIKVTLEDSGRAYVDLAAGSGGEIRDSVALEKLLSLHAQDMVRLT